MTTSDANHMTFTPTTLLLRIPPCPFDRVLESVGRAKAQVRRARLRDLGSIVKKATVELEAQAAEYAQLARSAAQDESAKIGSTLIRGGEAALRERGGIEPI